MATSYACQDCPFVAPSLAAARRHAKEAGPVFKPGGRMVTHALVRVTARNTPEGA